MSYGVFEHLAADESDTHRVARKALVLSDARIENRFGAFLRQARSQDEFLARLSIVEDDFAGIIHVACEEVGHKNSDAVAAAIIANFKLATDLCCKSCQGSSCDGDCCDHCCHGKKEASTRTASTHISARLPRMCPYHHEVASISLAQGEARAGFDAMAQHAFSDKHCQNAEYAGESCKFKPEMTTQSYWDKRDEKRKERAEQKSVEVIPTDTPLDAPVNEAPLSDSETFEDFGEETPSLEAEMPADELTEAPEPVLVAAKVMQVTAAGQNNLNAGGPEPKMDKRKWTPQNVEKPADDPDGRWPNKTKDILEPIIAENDDELEEIGEKTTEHQKLKSDDEDAGFNKDKNTGTSGPTRTFPKGKQADPVTAKADDIHKNPLVDLLGVSDDAVKQALASL